MVHNESKKVVVLMVVFYMKVISFPMDKARASSWVSDEALRNQQFL